jgi:hypothetical protein
MTARTGCDRVETEARDNSQGKGEDAGNVVRLPRDWLGPREELIPFGPAARRAEEAATRAAAEAEVLELTPRPQLAEPLDCTQDDFWGGDLQAIPKPVIGPRPDEPDAADLGTSEPPDERDPSADTNDVDSGCRAPDAPRVESGLAHTGSHRGHPKPTRARRHRQPSPRLPRSRVRLTAPAVGGAVAAAALAATVGISLAGSGTPTAAHHPATARAMTSAGSSLVLPDTLEPRLRRIVAQRPRPTVHPAHVTKARRVAPSPPRTATFVKASAPSQAVSAPPSTTPTSSSRSTSSITSSPVSTPVRSTTKTTSATSASTHKVQAGPIGQGAPFAPGQLG